MVSWKGSSLRLFSLRELFVISWVGVSSVVFVNVLIRFINRTLLNSPANVPNSWPISMFHLRVGNLPAHRLILLACASLFVFALAGAYVLSDHNGVGPVIAAGIVLVMLTNLLQGVRRSFVFPLVNKASYYTAAVTITDPIAFVRTYEEHQLVLPVHATTHPPGSVLTLYVYEQLLGSPKQVTVAMAVTALVVGGVLLFRFLCTYFERETAQYVTFLFVLLPSVQISSVVTLDALILAMMLGAVYCFTRESRIVAGGGTFVFLAIVSFQTFMVVFLVPVLGALALYRRDRLRLFGMLLVGLAVLYLVLYILADYNYVNSFLIASSQQSVAAKTFATTRPSKQQVLAATRQTTSIFWAVARPWKYIFTRIENVAAILLFFTPYLCVLLVRGIPALTTDREAFVLFGAAVITLCGLFAAGVYHTGETARAAMYIYPFLLLPVAAALRRARPTRTDKWLLAGLVFGQAFFMQFLGGYVW